MSGVRTAMSWGCRFEQVFFEDLQFAQRAVGADDADAVVGCGRAVGQGEGLDVVLQAVEEAV